MPTPRPAFVLSAVAAALLLSGCSAPAGPDSGGPQDAAGAQSRSEACAIVEQTMIEFGDSSSELGTNDDPQVDIEAYADLSGSATERLTAITNEEVEDGAAAVATALSDYVTFLQTAMSDPTDAPELTDEFTALQEAFAEVTAICAS
ncbi:hypothetical protein [Microbacterium hominis]|uniref:Uncharacterized protein n=1 Tax=Microbacterium hominis TaxID=162426 RepID=A0A7D4Q2R6_9MICO|nr:hypothetical protein [Microbacterium hominis]QKJ20838.1 hypothetical protein HQM25_16705 [Microbacterium hominis]